MPAWLRTALLPLAIALGGCASLPEPVPRAPSAAIASADSTKLDKIALASRPADASLSGFRLIHVGITALHARLDLLRAAQRSLDLQYYHLHDDETGRLILRELRLAAQRGVRVRLLVDDMYTQGMEPLLLGLAAFPNAEVRLFNPFPTRGGTASRFAAALADFSRVHRRMHNKLFVADGAVAIVGGRNLGNDYVFRSEVINFLDFDSVVVGAVLPQLGSLFDVYWNSPHAYPVDAIMPSNASATQRQQVFDRAVALDRAPEPPAPPAADRLGYPPLAVDLARGRFDLSWGPARAFADAPDKVVGKPRTEEQTSGAALDNVRRTLVAEMSRAKEELFLTTPYFVPGPVALERMRNNIGRGLSISILTNSLAGSDEPVVHTGYRRYREEMLRAGVRLYELSPKHSQYLVLAGMQPVPFRLHTKSAVLDQQVAFLGSLNLDPRSEEHNTELGVLVHNPTVARDMRKLVELFKNVAAYEVRLAPQRRYGLEWVRVDASGKVVETLDDEPETDRWTRWKVNFLSLLIPEGLL
jgi:cardiolipin synthase C